MTNEQILELAEKNLVIEYYQGKLRGIKVFRGNPIHIIKFAQAIIDEYEKDRQHNLGKDEYFNSWKN